MRRLLALVGLVALSIGLFAAVFSVVHRPLVVGEIARQLDYKLGYARTLSSPTIVVLAGSNGRYSHRCAELSAALGRPCVNASIGVGIGLDFQLDQWLPLLRAGDIVYMPLEYDQYGYSRAEMQGGLQNALLVHDRRDYLWEQGTGRVLDAYGSFDLSFLVQGLAEMALRHAGFRRRSSLETLTPQGDERGHTAVAAAAYAEFLRAGAFGRTAIPAASASREVLERFLGEAHRRGIVVVGGLPTIPDDVALAEDTVAAVRAVFEERGQRFLALDNRSRYPRSCFFDTLYHLNEECQCAHSRAVGRALALLNGPVPMD